MGGLIDGAATVLTEWFPGAVAAVGFRPQPKPYAKSMGAFRKRRAKLQRRLPGLRPVPPAPPDENSNGGAIIHPAVADPTVTHFAYLDHLHARYHENLIYRQTALMGNILERETAEEMAEELDPECYVKARVVLNQGNGIPRYDWTWNRERGWHYRWTGFLNNTWGVEVIYLSVPNLNGDFSDFLLDEAFFREFALAHPNAANFQGNILRSRVTYGGIDPYGPLFSSSRRGDLTQMADWIGENHVLAEDRWDGGSVPFGSPAPKGLI
jgi:hypothetical protein